MNRRRIDVGRSNNGVIKAGHLCLDLAEHKASIDGCDLDLSPLLLRLLHMLAEQPRQLITRHEIKQALWPNSDQIDTEQRLNSAMRALRATLEDDAETPRFIETVRSHGYRWIGSVPNAKPRSLANLKELAFAVLIVAAITILIIALRKPEPVPGPVPVTLVRAQTALDEWREAQDAAHLRAAGHAVANAMKALPSSPAAHILKAQFALESRWDWDAAAKGYATALELDPANTDARLGLAWLKVNRGDEVGALADANQLMLSSVPAGDRRIELGWLFIRAGRPDLATVACPVATQEVYGLSCAHTALAAVGDLEKARDAAVRLMQSTNASPAIVSQVKHKPAEAAYKQFLIWRARDFLLPDACNFDRAQVLADAGFDTEALDTLARSVAAHEPTAVKIRSSPAFMKLRTNPRYHALASQVGV